MINISNHRLTPLVSVSVLYFDGRGDGAHLTIELIELRSRSESLIAGATDESSLWIVDGSISEWLDDVQDGFETLYSLEVVSTSEMWQGIVGSGIEVRRVNDRACIVETASGRSVSISAATIHGTLATLIVNGD